MARSGRFNSNTMLNKAVKIGVEYMTLNIMNQTVNTLPNLPPIVKTITGISSAVASVFILKQAVAMLPSVGPLKSVASALIGVQATLIGIQQLPALMAALQGGFTTSLVTP